jgi:hypothetical protein
MLRLVRSNRVAKPVQVGRSLWVEPVEKEVPLDRPHTDRRKLPIWAPLREIWPRDSLLNVEISISSAYFSTVENMADCLQQNWSIGASDCGLQERFVAWMELKSWKC